MALHVARNLDLPVDLVTDKIAFLAKTDGGKTYSAGVLVEEFHGAGAQFVTIDNVGKWWALRLAADGKSPGIDVVVLGGEHGDLPLKPHVGAMIADLIVDQSISAVIDISEWIDAEQRKFVGDFATRLFQRKKRNISPLHLVLEEAQDFMPQKGFPKGTPDEQRIASRMAHALHRIVKVGRNYGLGVSLLSQRAAAVSKDALTQIDTLCVLRTTSPQDRAAIRAWFDHVGSEKAKKVIDELPTLKMGEMYICSPGRDLFKKVKFRKKQTWDSSATPKLGAKCVEPKKLTPLDLVNLKAAMEVVVEEHKANDPKQLRAELARLRAKVQQLETAAPSKVEERTVERIVEVPVLSDGQIASLGAAIDRIHEVVGHLGDSISRGTLEAARTREFASLAADERPQLQPGAPTSKTNGARQRAPTVPERPFAGRGAAHVAPVDIDGVTISKGPREILKTLASRHPTPLSRAQLSTLTGYSTRSISTYLGALRPTGTIDANRDGVNITEGGLVFLGDDLPPAVRTTAEMVTLWKPKVGKGPALILDLLVTAYVEGNGISRAALGKTTGYSERSISTYLGKLRTNGLVTTGRGDVWASDTLFPA